MKSSSFCYCSSRTNIIVTCLSTDATRVLGIMKVQGKMIFLVVILTKEIRELCYARSDNRTATISSFRVVILIISERVCIPRKAFVILGVAGCRVKLLRCHSIFHLFTSQLSNLASVLATMLPKYGMSRWMISALLHLFYLLRRS